MVAKTLTDERPIGGSTDHSVNKGTLFCGECLHRSHFDGDWTIVETDDRIHYICPNCHSEIMSRCHRPDEPARVDTYTRLNVREL